jgi:hypothetical protein
MGPAIAGIAWLDDLHDRDRARRTFAISAG